MYHRLMLIIISCCALSSCSCFLDGPNPRFTADLLEDHALITQEGDSYFYHTRDTTITEQEALCRFSQFSGCDTLYRLSVNKLASLIIRVSIEVDTEQYRLVLVNQERKMLIPIQQGPAIETITIKLEPGYYAMKVVGYCANGVLSLQLHATDDVTILPSNR